MGQFDTVWRVWLHTLAFTAVAAAQTYEYALNWRAIGTSVVARARAGYSGGPLSRVWFAADGQALEVQLRNGRLYRTVNFTDWTPVESPLPHSEPQPAVVDRLPEPAARAYASTGSPYRIFATGRWLWRSEDGGRSWVNLIAQGQTQLIGEQILGIALSAQDPDRLAVITREGLWASNDGGDSWISLNAGLPNLRLTRLLAAPQAGRGLLAEWENGALVEWLPGAKAAWLERTSSAERRETLAWRDATRQESLLTVHQTDRARLLRSVDGGQRWDDLTADLPAREIMGIAADRPTGAIYLATERGVYYTVYNLESNSAPTSWVRLGGNIPREPALDVMLNDGGNFLYVSLAGEGVFLTHAPHRRKQPVLISAADLSSGAASPGALVSVLGLKVNDAQVAGRPVPVLSATFDESQFQIPYDAAVAPLGLDLNGEGRQLRMDLNLAPTSPAIFTDRDGAPLLVHAETGELLDPSQPVRSGDRIQILLTGLGRVEPPWPAGIAAPANNPPRVVTPVTVWLNGQTLAVTRAELAPGYVGFYVVEAQLPPVLDDGFAELRVEAGGRSSQPIRLRTAFE
jgi:uncharacterized protein (TIGR03437 family)